GDSFDESVELSEGYTDGVDNVNAGCTFTCTVTEIYNDNYCLPTDATSPEYTIEKAVVNAPSAGSVIYDGKRQTANVTSSALYKVTTNEGGSDAGSYPVVLTLTDSANYEWADGTEGAELTLEFVIGQREVTLEWTAPESLVYDGYAKWPTVTLGNVIEGDSFDESVELSEGYTDGVDNVNAGCTFTCTVTEIYNDNYCLPTDATSPEYTITAKEISGSDFTVDTSDQMYLGEAVTPEVSLSETADTSLQEGTDYIVSYADNDGAGEATVTIKGIGNYTGTLTYTFTITKGLVEAPVIDSVTYNGVVQVADVTDTDFYIVTENEGGSDAGSYPVVLTLIESANYEWVDGTEGAELTLEFLIEQKEISSSDFELSATDGDSGITVTVTPTNHYMKEGKGYTWSFINEEFMVTITGIGSCTGTLYFSIEETSDGYEFIELTDYAQDAGLLFVPFISGEIMCHAKRKKKRKKGK
ncbi:MAG: hypothetical protein LUF32_01830, partial [Clostridiales bacterium]|nr:hypothetical protein [Clostridiales bacterium]